MADQRPAAGVVADQLGVLHRVPATRAVFPGSIGHRRGAGRPARRCRADTGQPRQPAVVAADPGSEHRLRGAVDSQFTGEVAAAVQPLRRSGGRAAGRPHRRRRLHAGGPAGAGGTDRLDAVADVAADRASPSTGNRSTRAQPVYTINSVSSFDPDRVAGTGQVASDPFYVTTGGAIVGLLDEQPIPGELGTGATPVSSAAKSAATGTIAAVAADPGWRPGAADGPPGGGRRGRPGAEGGHPDPPEFHARRRRGLGGAERGDKARGVPGFGHREAQPGTGGVDRVDRQGHR